MLFVVGLYVAFVTLGCKGRHHRLLLWLKGFILGFCGVCFDSCYDPVYFFLVFLGLLAYAVDFVV